MKRLYDWRAGAQVSYDWFDPSTDVLRGDIDAGDNPENYRAVMGELQEDFTPGLPIDGYDAGKSATLIVYSGALASADPLAVRAGANTLVFETGVVITFTTATAGAVDPTTKGTIYTVSTIKSGRFCSDDFIELDTDGNPVAIAAGTRFVMFRDSEGRIDTNGFHFKAVSGSVPLGVQIESTATTTGTSFTNTVDIGTFTCINLQEPSPTIVSASRNGGGDLVLIGRARTRYPEDNGQGNDYLHRMSAKQFGTNTYQYNVVLNVSGTERTFTLQTVSPRCSFNFTITAADLVTAFGSAPTTGAIDGTVAIWGSLGPGRAASFKGI
jgi:hypothetical protein